MSWLQSRMSLFALLPLLPFALACGSDTTDPDPDPDPEPEGYAFVYEPPAGAPAITSMSLRGTFNNWGQTPMELQDDGSWVAYVELDSAITYQYKFFINGSWIPDMCSDPTWGHTPTLMVHDEADGCVDDGNGGRNAVITLGEVGLEFSHSPTDPVDVSVAADRISIRFGARAGRVQAAWLEVGGDSIGMQPQFTRGLEDVWRASVPTTVSGYTIRLVTDEGVLTRGPYSVPAELFRAVDWVSRSVGYQIFPERFWNGDLSNDSLTLSTDEYGPNELWNSNGPTLAASWTAQPNGQHCCHQYFGGDLAGILEKRNHLTELGVDVVYLNPIWHNGSAHGYDTFDYDRVAPEYGDSALLRSFVDLMHADGIRLIWDFVPNHVGLGFGPFVEASEIGQASEYYDWFNFHPDGDGIQRGDGDDYDGWWGIASLPELQTEVPDVFEYLMTVAENWTAYGFDGIRVDVAPDIDNRLQFFNAFRDRTKAIDPEVYLVGEVWGRDPTWLQGDQFDALMNYSIARDVVAGFANVTTSPGQAWSAMVEMFATYPEAATAMLFNISASHDTGRLLTLLGGGGTLSAVPGDAAIQRQKLASALLYALPGMPVTYYGDECAMTGSGPDAANHLSRRTMDWPRCTDDVRGMVDHYTLLAGLKHGLDALGSPVIRQYTVTGSLLSFFRGEPGVGEVLAVFNQSGSVQTFALPAGAWRDAMPAGAVVTGSVDVPARGWLYLVRQ